MSAREWLAASVMAHLDENALLDPLRVMDRASPRAGVPFALIEDPVLADWRLSGCQGREGRLAISFADDGEEPRRLRFLMGRVEEAMGTLPADLGGEGWRLARLRLVRSRVARGKGDRWTGTTEYEVRLYRANA